MLETNIHKTKPDAWWVSAALGTIRAVVLVFDVLTFPLHLLIQRPWRKRAQSRRIKVATRSTTITVACIEDMHRVCR
ncbi:jg246 [Pararge aegeria aegeria]|uniref:Jg246 protein n=1 Tax=Pararge aegeria aegeria TaxID=348720 RepID=A0A8S4R0T9_9NEOP|nr:jg246 [Pararge aegeria aegeria]